MVIVLKFATWILLFAILSCEWWNENESPSSRLGCIQEGFLLEQKLVTKQSLFGTCHSIALKVNSKVVLVLKLLKHYAMKTYGEWIYSSLDLSTSWRWVVSFKNLPLYSRGKSPQYPLDRRLGGPQTLSGRYGHINILDPTVTQTPPTPRS
jgi:hypothetical protein